MQLWEKNREIINDYNKQQIELYKANLADSRLSLQNKLALNNQVAAAYRDYRNWESTKAQNLRDHQAALKDQERVQRDNEKWVRTQRDKLYNVLGKPNITAQYWAWVRKESGGKVDIKPTNTIAEVEQAEKDYPISKFLAEEQEQEVKRAAEKAEAVEKARVRGKYEEEQREKKLEEEEQKRIHPGGTKDNPLGLNLGSE